MGIASMVLGIVSLILTFMPFFWLIAFIPALIALILGIISLCQKKSKGQSIAGIVLSVIVFVLIVVSFNHISTNFNSTTSTNIETGKQETTSHEDLKQNIAIEPLGITANGDFAFKVKNNNDQAVFIDTVNTIFKDENGTFMEKASSQNQYFGVEANSEIVNYAWGFEKDFSKYPTTEFEIELSDNYMSEDKLINNFEVVSNNTGKQIAVEIQNNNNSNLEYLNVVVAYYQNGQIVGCQSGSTMETTQANGKAYVNVNYPQDKKYDEVKFDDYKTYFLGAEKEM